MIWKFRKTGWLADWTVRCEFMRLFTRDSLHLLFVGQALLYPFPIFLGKLKTHF